MNERIAKIILAIALLWPTAPARAQEPPEVHWQKATQAIEDHLPSLAIAPLEALLQSEGQTLPAEKTQIFALLLEALVRSERAQNALERASASPQWANTPAALFWLARAHAVQGEHTAALEKLSKIPADQPPWSRRAQWNRARILVELSEYESANTILEALRRDPAEDDIRFWASLLLAENQLREEQLAAAIATLQAYPASEILLKETSLTPTKLSALRSLRAAIAWQQGENTLAQQLLEANLANPQGARADHHALDHLLLARVYHRLGQREKAIEILLQFLALDIGAPYAPRALSLLSDWDFFSSSTAERSPLLQSDNPLLAPYVRYYQALALRKEDKYQDARAAAASIARDFPEHPLATRGTFLNAEIALAEGRGAEAIEILQPLDPTALADSARSHWHFLQGHALAQLGKNLQASDAFLQASSGSELYPPLAFFNAALCALANDDEERFFAEYQKLVALDTQTPLRGELILEQGLYRAAHRQPEAKETLQRFTKEFYDHPRVAEAWLALTELALLDLPPKVVSAREWLGKAEENLKDPQMREQLDYTRLWLEEASGDLQSAFAQGKLFLDQWPSSSHVPAVRMKMGELAFRLKDYPQAKIQLGLLARDYPDTAWAEIALYFAAQATLELQSPESLDDAILLWQEIVNQKGFLSREARFQQALAKFRSGAYRDALELIDRLLNEEPPPEMMRPALWLQGRSHFAMAAEEAESLQKAEQSFVQLIDHSENNPFWKQAALYGIAQTSEKAQNEELALENYYRILQEFEIERATEPEANPYWLFQAGFRSIALLEKSEKWEAAIAVAERLGAVGGTRAREAQRLAEGLRLRHFIWEEEKLP